MSASMSIQTRDSLQPLTDNSSTSSANTSQDLTGFGDISQSEINFVPSLPSEVVIKRPPSYRRNAKRPLPPTLCKSISTKFKDQADLSALLDDLRVKRENMAEASKSTESTAGKLVVRPSGTARKLPAPLQIINEARRGSDTPPSPVSPSRPFRGNAPLPRRSPLPRWDLLDPDVYLEGKQYKLRSSSRR